MNPIRISNQEPCGPIQADLSAMLDGELDAAVVRRVLVHSDVCPACGTFLKGIRDQARAHRELAACGLTESESPRLDDAVLDDVEKHDAAQHRGSRVRSDELRRRLLKNQRQLARVLYELGRGFVLMGVDPDFNRVVAREPVPVPDMCLRGRNLLDEVERMGTRGDINLGKEWVRAKVLFGQRDVRDPEANLAKGKRLLTEALMLWEGYHEARIYLGHVYQVEQLPEDALRAFTQVLEGTADPVMRAYALENLGNLHLEQERYELAAATFQELVDSGVIEREPRFHTTYFNLALVCGYMLDFDQCEHWLAILDKRFPHKRRPMAAEITMRSRFVGTVQRFPEVRERFAVRFPIWFAGRDT